ncbi:glycoside hydrolase family 6 protein [Conexibacter sp. JD483]|uniref:glycoside hydrolase family 6 protein n=1 Tax=unclassified Conexibacter TaxID=2627773 RepID=UPI00271A9071|nr:MULTISPECIES: glycoside hydrolase family 6 protein [unclassified Conexibacter]MDO8185077.1 glycoside hydrolase family 6 protein [Conexibacter sp. CPCC 205706]MDO8196787.1 glycoside hydrolase family 6 protein [Conexibacter sp. CPCC 205762]MDR9368035.1 glycoside hydrolase family 6 protein [Conexibacter sp. JD483]
MFKTLLRLAALIAAALLLLPAVASAGGTIRLTSDSYTVNEGDGEAVITVVRDDTSVRGEIRYDAYYDQSAEPGADWKPVQGRLDFAPGQAQAEFRIPIVDDTIVEGPETIKVGIYGPYNAKLGEPNRAKLTIIDNDSIGSERDPANPLGLDPAPTNGNPLQGARFFVDREWGLAQVAMKKFRGKKGAQKLKVIADQPETKRFGTWTKAPRHEIATYLQRVQTTDPGSIPLLATYRLKHLQCGGVSDSPADVASYKKWYDEFAAGIGNERVVLFYEIDALITMKCLSGSGRAARIDEVTYAIDVLSKLPHAVVYVDAGSGLAHGANYIGAKLRQVGVNKIQGFFTNATHQNWTSKEIKYARQLVKLTGGKAHYVVNTSGNGNGPAVPRDRVKEGNSYRCNARENGLGPKPTSDVPSKFKGLDALAWIGNPGRSAGRCALKLYRSVPPTGTFWFDYALRLINQADFRIR